MLMHGTLLVGVNQTLNRGCHLYSAGWPWRWALADISSIDCWLSTNQKEGWWPLGSPYVRDDVMKVLEVAQWPSGMVVPVSEVREASRSVSRLCPLSEPLAGNIGVLVSLLQRIHRRLLSLPCIHHNHELIDTIMLYMNQCHREQDRP